MADDKPTLVINDDLLKQIQDMVQQQDAPVSATAIGTAPIQPWSPKDAMVPQVGNIDPAIIDGLGMSNTIIISTETAAMLATITVSIGQNGNWFVGNSDTGVAAKGTDLNKVVRPFGTYQQTQMSWDPTKSSLHLAQGGLYVTYTSATGEFHQFSVSGNHTITVTAGTTLLSISADGNIHEYTDVNKDSVPESEVILGTFHTVGSDTVFTPFPTIVEALTSLRKATMSYGDLLLNIINAGTKQVDRVIAEGDSQVSRLGTEATNQIGIIQAASVIEVDAVHTAGVTAVAGIDRRYSKISAAITGALQNQKDAAASAATATAKAAEAASSAASATASESVIASKSLASDKALKDAIAAAASAQNWAEGSGTSSAKYWAEQAKNTIQIGAYPANVDIDLKSASIYVGDENSLARRAVIVYRQINPVTGTWCSAIHDVSSIGKARFTYFDGDDTNTEALEVGRGFLWHYQATIPGVGAKVFTETNPPKVSEIVGLPDLNKAMADATAAKAAAEKAAKDVLAYVTGALADGGLFAPTAAVEYPPTSASGMPDTHWTISFPNRDDEYTYTTGSLKGSKVVSGDGLIWKAATDAWTLLFGSKPTGVAAATELEIIKAAQTGSKQPGINVEFGSSTKSLVLKSRDRPTIKEGTTTKLMAYREDVEALEAKSVLVGGASMTGPLTYKDVGGAILQFLTSGILGEIFGARALQNSGIVEVGYEKFKLLLRASDTPKLEIGTGGNKKTVTLLTDETVTWGGKGGFSGDVVLGEHALYANDGAIALKDNDIQHEGLQVGDASAAGQLTTIHSVGNPKVLVGTKEGTLYSSVNKPTASELGVRPDSWTPNAVAVGARADNWMPSLTDLGLDNLHNWVATSDYNGTSTTKYATQKAVNEAAKAPLLAADQKRKITISTAAPTGGADGDIWLQY